MYFLFKILLSALLIATISAVSRRFPVMGALIASLPLVSVLGMVWLWHDTHDTQRLTTHSEATFWYVLPSLPMFLVIPYLLRLAVPFWLALTLGLLLTMGLYTLMIIVARRFGFGL